MATPLHFPPQRLGTTIVYEVDFNSATGANVAFAGSEALACAVFPAGGGGAIAAPAIAWSDPPHGLARITLDADDSLFGPTVYRIAATIDGRPGLPEESYVSFFREAAAGDAFPSVRTVRSGTAAYCTVEEFLRHVDRDFAGQLVRDDGGVDDAEGELPFDDVVGEALRHASGEVESACTRGNLYTPADLAVLAASGGNGAAFLRGLVADLAAARLRARRAHVAEPLPQEQKAMELLDALSRGVRIFPVAEAQDAGLIRSRFETPEERRQVGYLTDDSRFWGRRSHAYRSRF